MMLALGIADDMDHPGCIKHYAHNEIPNNMCDFH